MEKAELVFTGRELLEVVRPLSSTRQDAWYLLFTIPGKWKLSGPYDRQTAEGEFAKFKPSSQEAVTLLEAKMAKVAEGEVRIL